MSAVVSAMLTLFIESDVTANGGHEPPDVLRDLDRSSSRTSAEQQEESESALKKLKIGKGSINQLPAGMKATTINPARPNSQFDPFVTAFQKQIAASLNLPVEELTLYYSSSYSAARAAMLQAWRMYIVERKKLEMYYANPLRTLVIQEAAARGLVDLPGFFSNPLARHAWLRCKWVGPARGAIDEEKEARAAEKRMNMGLTTLAEETASMTGNDSDRVRQARALEQEKLKKQGLLKA
ncbi:phage portal protein [Magnetococcus sp. PR-3]|uniref:phage portal protein n=1 Tax=Magnetococcus sp. PR-3 TaxID=3120355 RepID=UPI002FCE0176